MAWIRIKIKWILSTRKSDLGAFYLFTTFMVKKKYEGRGVNKVRSCLADVALGKRRHLFNPFFCSLVFKFKHFNFFYNLITLKKNYTYSYADDKLHIGKCTGLLKYQKTFCHHFQSDRDLVMSNFFSESEQLQGL